MLIKVYLIARKAHRGQKDKAGKSYIHHPIAVAKGVKGKECKIVALLHDVVEDSDITLDVLRNIGFNERIIEAISAITKIEGEDYTSYLNRVKSNELARIVKLSDLRHNSDLSRLKTVTQKDKERVEKYHFAIDFLTAT